MRFRAAFIFVAAVSAATIASCGGAQTASPAPDRVARRTPILFDADADANGVAGADADADADTEPRNDAWLRVVGNHIVTHDGRPFHGRGANLHDPRSCDGCTYLPLNVAEVERRGDALVDEWKANLVRFDLEAYASSAYPKGDHRVSGQWKSIIDDPAYFTAVQTIVYHLTRKGAYVLVSEWLDPTTTANEWPTPATDREWAALARAFAGDPHVLYGLVNEPHDDPAKNSEAFAALNRCAQTIRNVEDALGAQHHVIAVPGIDGYARNVAYYVDHPITAGGGINIAYEAHIYNPPSDFEKMLVAPSAKIPILIGEFGPASSPPMTLNDVTTLLDLAEKLEIPYIAWNFHANCPPNLLQKIGDAGGCGIAAPLTPTPDWGMLIKNRLATPW